jgi:hypothetical protein
MEPVSNEVCVPWVELPSSSLGKDPFLAVNVQCGERMLLFQIDTGSSVTVLRESLRSLVDAHPVSRAEIMGPSGNPTEQTLYTTSSLNLGGMALKNEVLVVFPDQQLDALLGGPSIPTASAEAGRISADHTSHQIDGVLGATLLQRGEVEFNQPLKTLIIRSFENSLMSTLRLRLPMVWDDALNGFGIPVEVGSERNRRFILDTGTNAEIIFDSEGQYGKLIQQTKPIGSAQAKTIRGNYLLEIYRLPFPVTVGAQRYEPGAPVYVEKRSLHRHTGSVGIPLIWGHKRVVLNLQQQFLGVEPL